MRNRRTLKMYEDLYRDSTRLFHGGPDSAAVETILFPNGRPEILIRDASGRGFVIRASRGPAGFSLQVDVAGCGYRADVSGNLGPNLDTFHTKDAKYLEICQYDQTDSAQAHRAWYAAEANHPDGKHAPVKSRPVFDAPAEFTANASEAFNGSR